MIIRLTALVFILLTLGCGSNNNAEIPVQEAIKVDPDYRPHLARIKKKEISLDQNDPEAKISLARNFYFIFDGSGSMSDAPDRDCLGETQFPLKLQGAQFAVQEFLKKVPDDIQIGLLVFDYAGTREVVPLGTGNRQQFMTAINAVDAGGGTPLANAIRFGAGQLKKQYQRQLGYGEYRIVVVTDGIAKKIPAAATYAMEYGFPIYAIGLCVRENHPLRDYALSYRAADSMEDLTKGLEDTLAELPVYDAQSFIEQ